MDTLGKRIVFRRETLGFTQKELAARLEITPTRLNYYEKDKREPDVMMIKKIAHILKVDTGYLLGEWQPDMYEDFRNAKTDEERLFLLERWGVPSDLQSEYRQLSRTGIFAIPSSQVFPLVGDIACGAPILAEQNIAEYINFPGDLHADFCLRCRGDSMIDARIHDGDIVFIRQQPDVENGEIAAVLIGEEATLKRVYHSDNTLTLMAANPAYPPMIYSGSQLDEARILGKAVNFLSTVK